MLAPGVLIERYELVGPIGEGGMAHVWAARQHGKHGFEKLVALKVIHSRYAENPTFRAMFLDEARLVAPLVHRNVAQVFDLGDTGELVYIVLEYVDGDSLHALTAPHRTVPTSIALRIVADACAGLAAVHDLTDANGAPRNIVHRDVSPQNILLSQSGDVKLIDFGIAKARDRMVQTTDASTVKGKLRYMAPEQARNVEVSPATDVFGMGAVLFRLLVGKAPYAAANDIATVQALLAGAAPLQELPLHLPPEVAAIVAQSIAPRPEDRFLSAKALKEAIELVLAGEPRRPDVASWVQANLSEQARSRKAQLAARLASAPSLRAASPAPAAEKATVVMTEKVPDKEMESAPPATEAMEGGIPELDVGVGAGGRTIPLAQPLRERAVTPAPAPAPAFMDVRALVAQARAGGPPPPPPPPPSTPPPARDTATMADAPSLPLPPTRPKERVLDPYPEAPRLELAVVPRRAAEAPKWGNAPKIAAIVLVATVAVAALLLLLPAIAKSRALAFARHAGFEMTAASAGVGLSGLHLKDVTLRSARAPGFTATIPELTSGFTGRDVHLVSPVFRLEGELVDLEVGLGALLVEDRKLLAGTATSPRRLAMVGGKLDWIAKDTSFSFDDIALEVESRGEGEEDVKGTIATTFIKTAATKFGPWSASIDRNPTALRVRVAFDPPVADGPSALWVSGANVPTELTVKALHYQWAHLGLHPDELGIPADPTSEIDLLMNATIPVATPGSAKITTTISRLRPQGFAGPVDLHIEGTAASGVNKPFALDKLTFSAGPFTGTLGGTITPYDHGIRADVLFKVTPIVCANVARAAGGPASFVQALGQVTGALRVTGTVNVSGVVKYDSAAPADASVTYLAKESCGVSIFGL